MNERVRIYLESCGFDMIMNVPGASHMGGVWERQIRTVRNVLTAILTSANSRLDSSSLRTFFYEVMAIVNSRPLAIDNLNDPCGPEALTPNHILTMKSRMLMPHPESFNAKTFMLGKDGDEYNTWQTSSGLDGRRSTSLTFKCDRNGIKNKETCASGTLYC